MMLNATKLAAVLAISTFTIGFGVSGSMAGITDAQLKNKSGIIYEKPACPEGQDWNEETKACEAKKAE